MRREWMASPSGGASSSPAADAPTRTAAGAGARRRRERRTSSSGCRSRVAPRDEQGRAAPAARPGRRRCSSATSRSDAATPVIRRSGGRLAIYLTVYPRQHLDAASRTPTGPRSTLLAVVARQRGLRLIVGNEPTARFRILAPTTAAELARRRRRRAPALPARVRARGRRQSITSIGGRSPRGVDRRRHGPRRTRRPRHPGRAHARRPQRPSPGIFALAFHRTPRARARRRRPHAPSARRRVGLADYGKLVGLLGRAFDGPRQPGSRLPIVYTEFGIDDDHPAAARQRATPAASRDDEAGRRAAGTVYRRRSRSRSASRPCRPASRSTRSTRAISTACSRRLLRRRPAEAEPRRAGTRSTPSSAGSSRWCPGLRLRPSVFAVFPTAPPARGRRSTRPRHLRHRLRVHRAGRRVPRRTTVLDAAGRRRRRVPPTVERGPYRSASTPGSSSRRGRP